METSSPRQTTKSIFRNVVYGSLTWFLPLIMSFIATPVIVRSLGNNDYGIYALVLGFISYSFTFSFGRAITKYIAEYRVSGETDKISDVISATFFINIVVGLAGVVTTVLLAGWLVRDVFKIEPAAQQKSITAIYLASAIIFLWMFNQVFTSILQGIQRFDVYSKIFTASSFVLTSGNLALAYSGFGLISLLIWNVSVLCIFFAVYFFSARRLLPEFHIKFRFSRETLRLVLRYSAGIVGYQVAANILLLFERGWITQQLGTESLTYYVVPMSLGLYLHGFVTSLVLVIFPLASELNNQRDKLLRLYLKATKVICMIIVFVVATVMVQSHNFLQLWMGDNFAEHSSVLLMLHITCFSMLAIMSITWQMTEGLGFPQFNALTTAISTIIGVSLMLVLIGSFGTVGVAAARLAGMGTIFFSIFVVEKWFFKKVQLRFWVGLAINLIIAAVSAVVVEYLIVRSLPVSWPVLVLSVAFGGSMYCLVLWFLNFVTSDEKLLIRQVFSR